MDSVGNINACVFALDTISRYYSNEVNESGLSVWNDYKNPITTAIYQLFMDNLHGLHVGYEGTFTTLLDMFCSHLNYFFCSFIIFIMQQF